MKDPRKIGPKEASEILEKEGIIIDIEEAKEILDFLYIMAEIAVDQEIKWQNNRKLHIE